MDRDSLKELLEKVRSGATDIDAAIERLRALPFEDLGFASIDHHRHIRCGFPEVIFCQGKRPAEVVEIAKRLLAHGKRLLATRADEETIVLLKREFPDAVHYERARAVTVAREPVEKAGLICLLSAGTSDIPVAEEARATAEIMGARVDAHYDVGVAGIHRLLAKTAELQAANVVIVVAGMEGALASVVGGLVDAPVIAVPTSVGYGASFGGIAPLLTMLNSCAAGVAVVNIDNGFGAGYMAALINGLAVGKNGNAGKK
jgi:hypothetical protein